MPRKGHRPTETAILAAVLFAGSIPAAPLPDAILLVRRGAGRLGLPANWQGNESLPKNGYDNEIAVLSPVRPGGKIRTLFRPAGGAFVGDLDLHFDADRLLFSMPGGNGRWQVHEMEVDGTGLRELPLILRPDVDNFDACYVPDGAIIFSSTAPRVGVPCVRGASHVTNLYRYDPGSGTIRQLTFDQDHDWCPTVLGDGRILYLRWEYADLPHFVSRILFHMNPDGTGQAEYYGSNSYWPNSMFYARPIPNHPSRFAAIVTGHHGVPRMGELVLFDAAKGKREADGVIQRIPGRGRRVEPIILDELVDASWPKFLHPYPLSDEHFLVSCQPAPGANGGIYLVDVFDNMVLLAEEPGYALLEPIPLRKTPKPPVIPPRVDLSRKDAVVYLTDVYRGRGLDGIPRGEVKALRLFTYHFAYYDMGGQYDRIGLDGPWDIKQVLGTVPVEPDGSASFRVPANTPISLQPLDGEGKALQLMRSWLTAMPGETLSCVGCHESQGTSPAVSSPMALRRPPSDIAPWHGPVRGFHFEREVQPVLDAYCIHCHDGGPRAGGVELPDFTTGPAVYPETSGKDGVKTSFPSSYLALRRHVRTTTMEGDMHLLPPMDVHADTTHLVQLLRKGHHGVRLDREAWDRLITWIDLNTPAYGTWGEIVGEKVMGDQRDRRRELMRLYAGRDEDPEAIFPPARLRPQPPAPPPAVESGPIPCDGWPFDRRVAQDRQAACGSARRTIDLGDGVTLDLVRIPAGAFAMGGDGAIDERPLARVEIERPFWLGRCEVTNREYARFDPAHDSRLEYGDFLHFSEEQRGFPLNRPDQPVVRVSWHEAMAFCRWLSQRTGEAFTLPSEAQWEYACRAGTETALPFGGADADFAPFANLADRSLWISDKPTWSAPGSWRPAIQGVDDRHRVSAPAGSYAPNAWGLCDMHGNAAEWTRTLYRPYPYDGGDGRDLSMRAGDRVVRGGAWDDPPHRARSAFRLAYRPYQRVYNVGFRVMCTAD